jgi:hypothetical protein
MGRDTKYPVPIRTRIRAETAAALAEEIIKRKSDSGAVARVLIEIGLGRINELSPVRRKKAPVKDSALFADAIRQNGSLAGNLQRLYTVARDQHRIDLPELLAAKDYVLTTSALLRRAIGQDDDA